jgi:hypothetical protein
VRVLNIGCLEGECRLSSHLHNEHAGLMKNH